MRISHVLLCLGLLGAHLVASAQWQWIDKDGRKVFSDRPPPSDIPDKSILKQPGRAPAASNAAANPADNAGGTPAGTAAKPNGAPSAKPEAAAKTDLEKQLLEKKKQAEKEEAAKHKAEEDRVAAARADNCRRAKEALVTYQSGVRISRANAQGEREFLDDAARAAETTRLQGIIASECR